MPHKVIQRVSGLIKAIGIDGRGGLFNRQIIFGHDPFIDWRGHRRQIDGFGIGTVIHLQKPTGVPDLCGKVPIAFEPAC